MERIGLVGLGDMGIGLAKNLINNGYPLKGFDLRPERLELLEQLGGQGVDSLETLGQECDVVFVMVLNGAQVQQVVLGEGGLIHSLAPGSAVVVTATIKPREIRVLTEPLKQKNLRLLDSPVSGGKSGADGGTLTLMTAADKAVFEELRPVLESVGKNICHVGEDVGQGQTVKAALQAFIGSTFTAIFESLVLGVKSGVDAQTLYEVFSTSGVSSPLFKNCASLIMSRNFKNTGSHIGTMHKDLGISMDMARENGVSLFTTAAAQQLFQAGISLFPEEDNWCIVKLLEQIAGVEVKGDLS